MGFASPIAWPGKLEGAGLSQPIPIFLLASSRLSCDSFALDGRPGHSRLAQPGWTSQGLERQPLQRLISRPPIRGLSRTQTAPAS